MGQGTGLSKGNGAALRAFNENKKRLALEKAKVQELQDLTEAGIVQSEVIVIPDASVPAKTFDSVQVNEELVTEKAQDKGKIVMNLNIDPNKDYRFELVDKSPANRNVIIGATNRIFDPVLNRIRQLRYIPVSNSIYEDEMDSSFFDLSTPYIGFNNNYLSVSGRDIRLLEYLIANDDNESNQNRLGNRPPLFRLIDNDLIEKRKTASYDLIDKVRDLIKDKDADQLRPLARIFYGIDSNDDNAVRNHLRDVISRTDIVEASKAAKVMIDNIANPKLERQYSVLKALDMGLIALKPDHNCVVWVNTGVLVCNVRNIKDQSKVAGELAEWTFLSEEGKLFWEVLSKKI